MSLINRTIFYAKDSNGKLALHSMAVVETSLGQMVEPLNLNRFNGDGQAFDIADEMSLITDVKIVDLNDLLSRPPFADQGTLLHGGVMHPKSGF